MKLALIIYNGWWAIKPNQTIDKNDVPIPRKSASLQLTLYFVSSQALNLGTEISPKDTAKVSDVVVVVRQKYVFFEKNLHL